ncbi:RHS repeat-associated core domain-containing protein [Streptomyces narbonensis]
MSDAAFRHAQFSAIPLETGNRPAGTRLGHITTGGSGDRRGEARPRQGLAAAHDTTAEDHFGSPHGEEAPQAGEAAARIQQIANETGGVLNVDYNLRECSRINNVMPTAEDDNTMSCYPVRWLPPGSVADSDPVLDWFNHYTVKSLTENDTVTDSPQKITSYAYGPAGWHRDDSQYTETNARTWGEFRGFRTVTVTTGSGNDGPKSQVRTTYRQGMNGDVRKSGTRSVSLTDALGGSVTDHEWLSGQVLQTETFDQAGGTVVRHAVTGSANEVATATQSRGSGLPDLVARYGSTKTTTTVSSKKADGTWQKAVTIKVTDPANGNRPLTELDQADGTADICTRSSYAAGPDAQRTNLVSETLKVSGANACAADATAANTVERKRVLFDGKPFGQADTTGNPTGTQVLEQYAGDGSAQFTTTASTTYDVYGRVLTVIDPTRTDSQHQGGSVTRTTYSPATGELPSTMTVSASAPGQPATTTWDTVTTLDPRRGLPLTVADPNGKTKTLRYDALGRMTGAWRPGRTPANEPNADMTFDYTVSQTVGVPSAITTSILKKDGTPPVYTHSINVLDGFGRDRQTQASPANPAYTGRLITDKLYDSQGRVRVANGSWYNNASGPVRTLAAVAESAVPAQTRTTYDGQGRPTVVATHSLGIEQNRTTTSYPGADRTDTVPPAGSWPSSVLTDARGQTTARWQYRTATVTGNATDATVSTYTYTPEGKASTRKDADGNTWSYDYDLRGRQITAREPDTGTTTQSYDAASRLVSSKDGRGKTLLRTYDLNDRQTGLYDGTVSGAKQLVGWTYDTVTNGKGKPASSTRYVGGTVGQAYTNAVTGYDNRARTLTGTRYYPIPGGMTMVRVGTGGLTIQQADHHGSGILTIDAGTLAVTRRAMDPFGNARGTQPAAGAWGGQKGFVGGTKDDTTGLTYLGARQYDPAAGRFLNADPVIDADDPQQWNGYAYSGSNPVNATDESGLFCDGCSANNDNSAWDANHGPGCTVDTCYDEYGNPDYSTVTGEDVSRKKQKYGKERVWNSVIPTRAQYRARVKLQGIMASSAMLAMVKFTQLNKHYLDGSGEEYVLAPEDVESLLASDGASENLDNYLIGVLTSVDKSGADEAVQFDSGWRNATAGKRSPDWFLGIRSFQYRATGAVEDGKITYKVEVYKNWNFDEGESVMGLDLGQFGDLHDAGLAQEFDVTGKSNPKTLGKLELGLWG